MSGWTIGSLLETAAGYLREKGSASPRLDAELLLAGALGIDRIHLYTEYDRPLDSCEVDHYRTLIGRRGRREPVAYILGKAYFRHLVLEVGPAVLIPRPETEELVDAAISVMRRKPLWGAAEASADPAPPSVEQPVVVDVGCGSGAIAISLAQETGIRVTAVDVSEEALAVAARNAAAAGLSEAIGFRRADLLEGVADSSLRLVVSNPPYIASGDIPGLEPDVRCFEPVGALDAGPDGLDVIRRLLPQAGRALVPGGTVLLEVGDGQAAEVAELATAAGFAAVAVHKDLSGKDRIVEASLPGADVIEMSSLDARRADELASALRAGGIVALPTDTVYGVAAAWDSKEGVKRLFSAKGRDAAQPVAVIFPSVRSVHESLPDLDDAAHRVMESLLPGPYTFVVTTEVARPTLVGTDDSLGVRVPDHPQLLALLDSLGLAVAATSANLSGTQAVASLSGVDPAILAHCAAALVADEEGPPLGLASTVVDLRPLARGERPEVLREGAVGAADVLERIAALG